MVVTVLRCILARRLLLLELNRLMVLLPSVDAKLRIVILAAAVSVVYNAGQISTLTKLPETLTVEAGGIRQATATPCKARCRQEVSTQPIFRNLR